MSQQSSIKNYFKIKSNNNLSLSTMVSSNLPKKRSLSLLTSTPIKVIKQEEGYETIDLSSDEDFKPKIQVTPIRVEKKENIEVTSTAHSATTSDKSNSSNKTEIYSPTPTTPSSAVKNTFYSPTKKKNVRKKLSMKKNLSFDLGSTSFQKSDFKDDKTSFFFEMLQKFVENKSLHCLIDESSCTLVKKCLELSEPGLRLICRLYWRKQGWYRYEEIKKIAKGNDASVDDPTVMLTINTLSNKELLGLSDSKSRTFDDLAAVLKADELKQICKEFKIKVGSKQDAVDALRTFSNTKPITRFFATVTTNTNVNLYRVLQNMSQKAGPTYMLPDKLRDIIHKIYVIMYLGINPSVLIEKRLELILINDKIKKEIYPIDKKIQLDDASVVFENKKDFDKYMVASSLYEVYMNETNLESKCSIVEEAFSCYNKINNSNEIIRYKLLPQWLRHFTPAHLYVKLMASGVQDLKRRTTDQYYQLALDILTKLIEQPTFRQHRKADWYAEKALILHTHYNEYDQAGQVLLDCFKSDLPEEVKDSIRPRACRIATQKNKKINNELTKILLEYATKESILEKNLKADHIRKVPMEKSWKGKSKFITRTEDGLIEQNCEEFCISHYLAHDDFTHGRHWEGRILNTIFFLLFWDIIYSKPRGVKGIFLSYFQMHPLDLLTDSFYNNRKALIDDWLIKIQQMPVDQLLTIIEKKWNERPEAELSDINRQSISMSEVLSVCKCLGAASVAAICRRLAVNYAYTRSGFPDLTLWNVHTNKIKFVEVKTDSDKPSIKQKQWMRYLEDNNIETSFCYLGINTARNKSRARESMDTCEEQIMSLT